MQRISVVGTSGSGKSTLAHELSLRLGIEHIELSAIFHDGEWAKLTRDEFRDAVVDRCSTETWITDDNYQSLVLDLIWARADTVIVLEYPRRIPMWRVTKRTVGRLLTRKQLYGGVREPWSNVLRFWDPDRSTIAWAWTTHTGNVAFYRAAANDPANDHLTFIFLTSPKEVRAFVDALPGATKAR